MILSWTLKNFKSVKGLKKLDLAPLTIFAGANSSGKSTVLQSILLAAQTIQNPITNKAIILNGHISKFGSFDDILSDGFEERSILIGFQMKPLLGEEDDDYSRYSRYFLRHTGDIKNISCEFSFSDEVRGVTSEFFKLQPRLERSFIKLNSSEGTFAEVEIVRSHKTSEERAKELHLNESQISKKDIEPLEFEVKKAEFSNEEFSMSFQRKNVDGKFVGAYLSHFIPSFLTVLYDQIDEEKRLFWQSLTTVSSNLEIIFHKYISEEAIELIKSNIQEVLEEYQTNPRRQFDFKRYEAPIKKLLEQFDYKNYQALVRGGILSRVLLSKLEEDRTKIMASLKKDFEKDYRLTTGYGYYELGGYIDHFFKRNLKYLGPLRDEPKPVYPLSGSSDPKDIGFKGENTAAVLELNKNVPIQYIKPNTFNLPNFKVQIVSDTLSNAVLDWLVYMGIAVKVDTLDKGKLGHEMRISTPGSKLPHDLTHVGVGVSQVLPILVLSLLSEPDSTLIFEQPELHLNPKVQTRLADFFFSMSLLKKQSLVETHSEYLINRLRFLVAVNEDPTISDNILMYFVEKEQQTSTYKKVKINKYGVIEDWPKGFFDENEETAASILRAAMEKRKQEKSKGE